MNRTDRFLHWLLPKFYKYRDIMQDIPCALCKATGTWTCRAGETSTCPECRGTKVSGQQLYLRRYFIKTLKDGRRIFLHNIRLSDQDRDLHDHPWDFTSLILTNGYYEKLPDGYNRIVAKGMRVKNKAEHTHAVKLLWGPTWTLVTASKARREWGFHTQTGWVDWRRYLGLPPTTPDSPEDMA